ncbi:conserved hypothetical protein [Candidatus Magnetomoraceae bacterium gMMP-15]
MIASYWNKIQSTIAAYSWIKSIEILRCDIEETDIENILVYRFRMHLKNNSLLEIMERVVYLKKSGTFNVTTYKYHWQDEKKRLIKRWDNAPHFPKLSGFPHHLHIAENNSVISCQPMTIFELFTTIEKDID